MPKSNRATATGNQTSATLDLSNCDREKIHQIAAIQTVGAFVAFGSVDQVIRHSSTNWGEFLADEKFSSELAGMKLRELLPKDLLAVVQERASGEAFRQKKKAYFEVPGNRPLDVYMYQLAGDLIALEVEELHTPTGRASKSAATSDEQLLSFLSDTGVTDSLEALSTLACRAIRALTGMDRVMLYRFFPPEWHGVVIGEDRIANSHSYLNHRFPATDIPKPARDLYLRNQVRFIHDSHAPTAEVLPKFAGASGAPIDLSDSRLRAVSPIHIEYLKNMGVRSSFSVAISVEGSLWGLFTCHASSPIRIPHRVRLQCEIIARTISFSAPLLEGRRIDSAQIEFTRRLHDFFGELKDSADPMDDLFRRHDSLADLFRSGGLALVTGERIDFAGRTPKRAEIAELAVWLRGRMASDDSPVFQTDRLATIDSRWQGLHEVVSGVVAYRLGDNEDSLFMVFRPEYVSTIQWGGDPRKTQAARDFKGPINPRVSFETWNEEVRGISRPWFSYELDGVRFLKDSVFDSLIRKEKLIRELSQRLKGKTSSAD